MNKEVERLLHLMKSYASDNDAQGYLTNSQVKLLLDYINQLETNIDEAIELIKKFDVFKEFSFPLMKRDEENQVKSSIDYEFKTTLYKQLSSILERGKE